MGKDLLRLLLYLLYPSLVNGFMLELPYRSCVNAEEKEFVFE
jgi:hypothetical protein